MPPTLRAEWPLAVRLAYWRPPLVLGFTHQSHDLVPTGMRLTATDLNPPMLEVARAKFQLGEQVNFRPADATALPFPDGSFDVVVCQFGVMFFPEKDKSYREIIVCSPPGGHYIIAIL